MKRLKRSILALSLTASFVCYGAATTTTEQSLTALYHILNHNSKSDMTSRLDTASAYFLGKPYILGALGEGVNAQFDQSPLYRFDGFDCETFVDTVLAIALSNDIPTFKQCINQIRYLNGNVNFITRNHFTSLDWNKNNQHQGFTQDITASIRLNDQPVALTATALIDKPSWYEHMDLSQIKLHHGSIEEQTKRLKELKSKGKKLTRIETTIPYLPLTALFDKQATPNLALFNQIPNASIIEIVRPNWDLRKTLGTCLNVSHLGFVFWKNGVPIFRQASSTQHKVVDVPLIDYLRNLLSSPTIKGINIQIILPQKPFVNKC